MITLHYLWYREICIYDLYLWFLFPSYLLVVNFQSIEEFYLSIFRLFQFDIKWCKCYSSDAWTNCEMVDLWGKWGIFPDNQPISPFLRMKCKINKYILISVWQSIALYTLFTENRNSIIQKVSNSLSERPISFHRGIRESKRWLYGRFITLYNLYNLWGKRYFYKWLDRCQWIHFAGVSGGEGKSMECPYFLLV